MIGWDLITAMVVIVSLSILTFLAGRRLGSDHGRSRSMLFAESLLLTLIFAWFLAGGLFWARAVPGSGALYWSNPMPMLLGFCAGLAVTSPQIRRWRRRLTVTALISMAAMYLALPIARPLMAPAAVAAGDNWSEQICLQSHGATCAPAAAATLLNLNRIPATESQMIDLCLTSRQGTEPLGLYRGITLASQRYQVSPRIASRDPNRWIREGQLPNVALVRFSEARPGSPIRRLWGPRGEGHAIVVLGFENGQWVLGDPAIGRVSWSDADFRRRFTGDAIYLAR